VRLLSRGERSEIGGEDVLLEDPDLRLIGELPAEARGEIAVELDGDELTGAAGEDGGNGSAAGSDFEDGAAGDVTERIGDGGLGGGADEEILAEFGAISESHGCSSNVNRPELCGVRSGAEYNRSFEALFRNRLGRWVRCGICFDCDAGGAAGRGFTVTV